MLVFGIQDVVVKLRWLLRKSGFGCGCLKVKFESETKVMVFYGKTMFSTTVSLGKGWKSPSKGRGSDADVSKPSLDPKRRSWDSMGKTMTSTTVSLGKGWKGPSKGRVVPEVQENSLDLGKDGSGFY